MRQVLAMQLGMNQRTWAALQERGVAEGSGLRLDFLYQAPGESQARALAAFVDRETDYEVQVQSGSGGLFKKKQWTVSGTTKNTQISASILDQWVMWMVAAGFQEGCEFDGWGAMVTGG
jgi:hypothetical protein